MSMEKLSQLCDTCQRIDLDNYFLVAESPETVELGPFQEIAKNIHCPLCSLVIRALNSHARPHWKTGVYPVEVCYLGRHKERSNSPVFETWFNSTSETLPNGMFGHSTTLAQIILMDQQIVHVASEAESSGCVQLVGEKIDISRIQNWVQTCVSVHGPNCNPPRLHIPESQELSLLLIDVRKMKLVECNWNSRYIALSYVWGSSGGLRSTQANIHRLQQDGALQELRSELPRAISDAIDFTNAIGEAYTWIDALCIVQDDISSKAKYISRMNEIYGNSLVTLVTLNDPSAPSALPGVAHPRAIVQSPVEINGLRLVSRLPQLFEVEQYSAWSRRAWTFQEGILSKRCLYFSDRQVFWQCRTSYQSEDCPDDHDRWAPDFERGRRTNALERETGNDFRRQFNVYESLVKQYSPKTLTFHVDSLFAFAGVLSTLSDKFGWSFASALPETAFDMALIWRPMFSATLRPRSQSVEKIDPSLCRSPTWCWTAWRGDLFWDPWRLDSYVGLGVSIKSEVASFWIQDCGQLRRVHRAGVFNSDTEVAKYTVSKMPAPESALVFEAKTIDTERYNISAPRMEQCAIWNSNVAGGGLSSYFRNHMSHSLWIYDSAGQHCGTLSGISPDEWPTQSKDGPRHDLILLSRGNQDEITMSTIQQFYDHLPLEYPSDQEYYEEIFDTRHYKYRSDWALNVMLVQWKSGLAERVAVGQMHVEAWKEIAQNSKLITLV